MSKEPIDERDEYMYIYINESLLLLFAYETNNILNQLCTIKLKYLKIYFHCS